MSFVDGNFYKYIYDLIKSNVLINLNTNEFDQIVDLLAVTINYLAYRFNFDLSKSDQYVYQLKQNNHRDLYAIFNMLLPFIDDKGGSFSLHKMMRDISDITIKKDEELSKGWNSRAHNVKKNIAKNPYILTNLQFNRHLQNQSYLNQVRENNEMLFEDEETSTDPHMVAFGEKIQNKNEYFYEYEYSIDDIRCNFYLLLNTIDRISNKLYVNWLNIRPMTWSYKNSDLYKKSYRYNKNTQKMEALLDDKSYKFEWFNPININTTQNQNQNHNVLLTYQGLSIGDYYNMIHHELYFGIKHYKWLLYELPIMSTYKGVTLYWHYILSHFKQLDEFINDDFDYEYIEAVYKNIVLEWNDGFKIIANNIGDDSIKDVIYNIIYFFQRKYSKIKTAESEGNYIMLNIAEMKLDEDIDEETNEQILKKITVEKILMSWNTMSLEHFYNFMKETINSFKKTWYGYNLIIKKKMHPFDDIIDVGPVKYNITYKNIYNWSKSMLIYVYTGIINPEIEVDRLNYYKDYTWHNIGDYSENYDLDDSITDKKMNSVLNASLILHHYNFTNAINGSSDWFNINGIIKNKLFVKIGINNQDAKQLNLKIGEIIKEHITDVVFESLIVRGLLSEFVLSKNTTDKSILSNEFDIIKKRRTESAKLEIFNKENVEEYKKCIYYLTDEPYENLPPRIEKDNVTWYFDYLPTAQWCTFYAMDWISQINFYHRYVNNRVLYVTGATGAGKSTQVPKLLLYGLKMINYNNIGKVISTQPRIKPTISNAKNIANEMGVPIVAYSKEVDADVKTNMGYVQFKTGKQIHLQPNKYQYYFREMTDGSLVNEIYKNPLLKKIEKIDDDDTYSKIHEYKLENLYDIIVVDESHEHNKNMDIILSMMRYAVKWNNSLKLVIVSATMDDDEPIYRRYYNDINDNLMYPHSIYNMTNMYIRLADAIQSAGELITDDVYVPIQMDRITVDRRIHISPPGETTQHKIEEEYLSYNTLNYVEAESKAIEKTLQIIATEAKGDILVFSIGGAQIKNIVTTLNERTPSHVIALPMYSELSEYWNDLAENTEKIKELTFHKSELFNEINSKGSSIAKVQIGTYSQAIVVATNVAEASITIVNLKYVVDTGYENSVKYDNITRSTVASVAPITEASRLQRKGRVGRMSSGKIYYMYAKDSHMDVLPSYKICIGNVKNDIYNMMRDSHDETLLISPDYDQLINKKLREIDDIHLIEIELNQKNMINGNIYLSTIAMNFMPTSLTYDKILKRNIYEENWLSIDKIMRFQNVFHRLQTKNADLFIKQDVLLSYLGDSTFKFQLLHSTYTTHSRYMTGYNLTSIIDLTGTFHLIHLAEDKMKRHLLTGIIMEEYNDNEYVTKIMAYVGTLLSSKFIMRGNYEYLSIDNLRFGIPKYDAKLFVFSFMQHQPHKKMYYNMIFNNTYTLNNSILYNDNTNDYFDKTVFSKKAFYVYEKLKFADIDVKDENLKLGCLIAIIYNSIINDNNDDVFKIVAGIFAFGPELRNMIPQIMVANKPRFVMDKNPLNQFKDNDGDIFVFLNIFNKLTADLQLLFDNENTDQNSSIVVTRQKYNEDKLTYLEIQQKIRDKIKNKDVKAYEYTYTNLSYQTYILLQNIDQQNNLSTERGYKDYYQYKQGSLRTSLIKSEMDAELLIKWSINRNLSYDKVKNMIKIYKDLKAKVNSDVDLFVWFKKINVNKEGTHKEKILKCFMHGFLENIAYYDPIKNDFTDIYNLNVMQFKTIYPATKKTDSIIQPYKFTLYLTKSNNGEPICLNRITTKMQIEIAPDEMLTLVRGLYHFKTNSIYANSSISTSTQELLHDVKNTYDKSYIEILAKKERMPQLYKMNKQLQQLKQKDDIKIIENMIKSVTELITKEKNKKNIKMHVKQLQQLNAKMAEISLFHSDIDIDELKDNITTLSKLYRNRLTEAKKNNNIIDIEMYVKELDDEPNNLVNYYEAILKITE